MIQSSSIPAISQPQNPKKEEWSLIDRHKALEYDRLESLEKYAQKNQQRQYKKQLDRQLAKNKGFSNSQRQEDRRYYQHMIREAERVKEKEEKAKMERAIQRRMIEEENKYRVTHLKRARNSDHDTGYHLDIGVHSEELRKERTQQKTKQMMDQLDKQVHLKQKERKMQKMQDIRIDQFHNQYQYDQFDRRKSNRNRHLQVPNVYQHYSSLQRVKKQIQTTQDHIIEHQAHEKQERERRINEEKARKYHQMNRKMKHTLDQQVNQKQRKNYEEVRKNRQESSYSMLGNLFREKKNPYDKKEYSEYLRKQAQIQNSRRMKDKYMTEQEYKLNINQLNKAVTGEYADRFYIDRSVGAIGQTKTKKLNQLHDAVNDEDGNLVKQKIQTIKQHHSHFPKSRGSQF